MKKTKRRPDPIGYALMLAQGVERVASMARAARRLPPGSAAQDAALKPAERALARLERLADRGPR